MKDYEVMKTMTVNSGLIRLSDSQARPRQHALNKTDRRDIYTVRDTLTFKIGEVIGLDSVSKVHAPFLKETKTGKK